MTVAVFAASRVGLFMVAIKRKKKHKVSEVLYLFLVFKIQHIQIKVTC